jgi:VanZ family protein
VIVAAVLYGISDELHQFFVPGRHLSLFDVFLDSVGVIFATMIYLIRLEWKSKN